MEEIKKIDWEKYLEAKSIVTLVVVGGAFGAAYLGKMDQSLALVLSTAIGSFNWFSKS